MVQNKNATSSTFDLNLTFKNTAAFAALVFVMHELHEIAHTAVGRLICGCWGPRNFNRWGLCCNNEYTIIASIAGPAITFAMMYLGYYLLSDRFSKQPGRQSLGFALIFGNLPFGRLFTALIGKGDELFELEHFFGDYLSHPVLWILAIVLVSALLLPPLLRAWKVLDSSIRLKAFSGFFLLPFIFDLLVVIIGMNALYQQGFLAQDGIIGSPLLVNLWTLIWIVALAIGWKQLRTLLVPSSATHS